MTFRIGLAVSLCRLALCASAGENADAVASFEIWDLPATGLVQVAVPDAVGAEGRLAVGVDGVSVRAQEVCGAGVCLLDPTSEQRARSRQAALTVTLRRQKDVPLPVPRPVDRLVVSNAAFQLAFDADRCGGLPNRLVWASGKTVANLGWGDRVYAEGRTGGHLSACRSARILDFGAGPLFRQIRTDGVFSHAKGPCPGEPRATYDWLFFGAGSEWVQLHMSFRTADGGTWTQLQAGIAEFPFSVFQQCAVPDARKGLSVHDLPRTGKPDRPAGNSWIAFLAGNDFAAVHSPDVCAYTDPKRKIDYLHGSNRVSYRQPWDGKPLVRRAFYRFGSSASPDVAFREEPPVRSPGGLRRLGMDAAVDAAGPGEEIATVLAGDLSVRVGVCDGAKAQLRSVRVKDRLIAAGRQQLFSVAVEDLATGRRLAFASDDAWRSVTTAGDAAGRSWTFAGPLGGALSNLTVTVRARPSADGGGLDWSFAGETGSDGFALAEATVGALELLSAGRGMRALYPGCMGEVKANPCSDSVRCDGSYPSMHCVMPWEAVWDEVSGRGFYVAAHDPQGGAKRVKLQGRTSDSTVRLELSHRLSWDRRAPGARSVMSGTIAWRPFAGDWYAAALLYRDWVREHAVWYPRMGPEGRVSTPQWFKELGFVVRTYGFASNAVADVKTCQDWLGVPVMAHWYSWHRQPFDNDYPHYFPGKPGFEEGVRDIHRLDARAVPYTNGHLWDLHDRGAEDWKFTSEGAYGACRRRDGSVYTEKYGSMETNGQPVVFAAMCPASRTWHDKVVDNCRKVVNGADLDGYYMDQVGAFSTVDCRNPEHGHPFGGGSWWQQSYREMLKDARASCRKPVFFATEGNAEHTFDQIDAFVCWNIPGGVDTVPAFEICYSGAVTVYCRSYMHPDRDSRQMRMKLANLLVDGHLIGWWPATYCTSPAMKDYLRACVRFRQRNAAWFYRGEMRRPPELLDAVPVWDEAWDIFGHKRPVRMPIVQTAARRILDYDYAADGSRIWASGRVRKAFVYFTNFSSGETATARVRLDGGDLGVDLSTAAFTRVDAEGARTPMTPAEIAAPLVFAPGCCFGIEIARAAD
ncbi:MAG: DUF6259 domain-containing protein [Kiritimatiellia bacterium]